MPVRSMENGKRLPLQWYTCVHILQSARQTVERKNGNFLVESLSLTNTISLCTRAVRTSLAVLIVTTRRAH